MNKRIVFRVPADIWPALFSTGLRVGDGGFSEDELRHAPMLEEVVIVGDHVHMIFTIGNPAHCIGREVRDLSWEAV